MENKIWWKFLIVFVLGCAIGCGTIYLIMRADAADARATITRISDELTIARRNTDAALATVAELGNSNTRLENDLRIAKDAGAASEARAREIQKNLRSTEQGLQRANATIDQLKGENSKLRSQVAELTGTVENLFSRIGEFENITIADAKRIGELENRVSGYVTQVGELQSRIDGYVQQVESIGGDISELGSISGQLDTTIADLATLSQEFSGASGSLDDILTAIERFVDEGAGRVVALEEISGRLEATVERLQSGIGSN